MVRTHNKDYMAINVVLGQIKRTKQRKSLSTTPLFIHSECSADADWFRAVTSTDAVTEVSILTPEYVCDVHTDNEV